MSGLPKSSLFALGAILVSTAFLGCEERVYPEPTESYSAVGCFEITRVDDEDPGPYSIGDAEGDSNWGFWFPYSITLDSAGNLLVTNIRGGYIERFVPNLDGSALWDAFWVWPRGRQESTYQLFIESFKESYFSEGLILVSESQSELGPAGFEQGKHVHKLLLPEPIFDIPDDNRPRFTSIKQTDILVGYPTTFQPGPVAFYPDDKLIYTDVVLSELYLFEDDALVAKTGDVGDQEGRFIKPMGICSTPAERIVVSDMYNHRLQLFTVEPNLVAKPDLEYRYTLQFERTIGEFGFNNGQLSAPFGVDSDSTGNIYVCDTRNARIQKFDGEG
ncbi:hypothetical protein KAU45_03325, partial [bacterium]|nr:hypothetical protein [bacterium]